MNFLAASVNVITSNDQVLREPVIQQQTARIFFSEEAFVAAVFERHVVCDRLRQQNH